ncbi:hypothetical protein K8I61_06530 [bacterium]|nr:hypothetical protein [bacterium]
MTTVMKRISGLRRPLAAAGCLVLLCFFLAAPASAQVNTDDVKTVFSIGNINAAFSFPLSAYLVDATDQLLLAETWRPVNRDGGPVGLAVDPYNERLFVSYEFSGVVDVFSARDASPLGQIPLIGTSDLCGMDVHQDRGHFYVIDRSQKNIYVFDSDTFAPLATWQTPSGGGIWDIDVIEDLGGQSVVFVTDSSNWVRWYNVDTHAEAGNSFILSNSVVGIGVYVEGGSNPIILATSEGGGHGPPDSPWLVKKDHGANLETKVDVKGTGRGIDVNQYKAHAYLSVGPGGLFNSPSLRTYDIATLTEIARADFPGGWQPTDVKATWITFGSSLKKTSTSHPNGDINMTEEVVFEIEITNHATRPIHELPLRDEYDTTQLTYLYSNPPSDDNNDDGIIDWSDLIPAVGHDLVSDEVFTVEVHFTAQPEACQDKVNGTNRAIMENAKDDNGGTLDTVNAIFDYVIHCVCAVDADCEDGVWCNGTETCVEGECQSTGNPCPIDDELWCNGDETVVCLEETQECGHTGDPCGEDDGNWCNGSESCDEEVDQCVSTDAPCEDDGQFCNGTESCTPNNLECQHSGNPCDVGETCDEEDDVCIPFEAEEPPNADPNIPTGDEEEEPGWPEGEVTGGCCGCG